MAVCSAYGIPHSEFLSWRPTDRDKAVWWELRQRSTCQSCGTRQEEWDPDRGGSRDAYRADLHQCAGCVERQRAEDAPDLKEQRGMSVILIRNRGV